MANLKDYYLLPNGVCAWDVARWLPFNLGCVVRYCIRCGRKAEETTDLDEMHIKDLMKARDYIDDEIERVRFIINAKRDNGEKK